MRKKSSSSLKKKRSKRSSKAKVSSKGKSAKHKSKKVRCEVSLSSSDYDDSKSLDTSVSSSSDDSYKSKRDRSRSRKDVKGHKKRPRRRSYSPDSCEDSLYDRKRKKAKRKHEYEGRENARRKKMIKREASVSSASSWSLSCSMCQGESASSGDSQYESCRGRSKRKEKGKQRFERGRSGSEKSSRYRARSRSLCICSSESSYERNNEKYIGKNNSRRLRSVITVAREVEESHEFSRDDTKVQEIVDDHDYPCRSNDSNDGATKRELDHHSLPATEEELVGDAETGDVNADSAWTSGSMKNKTSETSGDDVNGEDLESILRQKALENLRKFRGGVQSTAKVSNQKRKIVSQVKQPISDNIDMVQGKSNINNSAVGTELVNQTFVEETSIPVGRKKIFDSPRNIERLNMDKDISGSAINHLACVPERVIDADNPSYKFTDYRTNKAEFTAPESCYDSLQSHLSMKQGPVARRHHKLMVAENSKNGDTSEVSYITNHSRNDNVNNIRGLSSAVPKPSSHGKGQDEEVKEHLESELKQAYALHKPPNPKIPVFLGGVETNAARNIQSANDSGGHDKSSNSSTKFCIENSSLENNSAKLQDDSNQRSQFEQKTMNVVRGGEMVQVSYKVYIPKKTPALARRQLKR